MANKKASDSDYSKHDSLAGQGPKRSVEVPRCFSRNLRVGWRDRGLGRGDFGVITEDGVLVAEVKSVHGSLAGDLTLLPDFRNANLFAAAPLLYEACRATLSLLRQEGLTETDAYKKVHAALRRYQSAVEDYDSAQGER
jgi:hypothetical protein